MADMKTLNTRIKLKYDLHTEWMKPEKDPVLLAGEIAIAKVETAQTDPDTGLVNYVPSILMKVGDGEHKYSELGFTYGRAADVADWAKADTLQASAVSGLGEYIAQYVDETLGISVDTNTVYRLYTEDNKTYKLQSKAAGEADTAFADVANSTFTIDLSGVEADIQGLKDKVGEKAVGTQIDDKITELKLGETYAAKEHTHTKSEITDFAHTHTKSEITDFAHNHEISDVNGLSKAIEDATAAGTAASNALADYKALNDPKVQKNIDDIAAIKDGAAIDSFKDVEDKLGAITEGKTVAQMIGDAQTAATYDDTDVKADIQGLKDKVGETAVGDQIDAKITALKLDETYASKATYEAYVETNDAAVGANTAAIEKLNGNDQTEGSVDYKVAQEIAKIVNENNNGSIDTLNEIAAWIVNDTTGVAKMNADIAANTKAITDIKDGAALDSFKDVEDKIGTLTEATVAAEITAAKEAAVEEASYDDTTVKKDIQDLKDLVGTQSVDTQIDNKFAAFKTGDFATEQGRIDDLEDAVEGLATIAETGNVDDLVQTANTYIVFDCGTASTII